MIYLPRCNSGKIGDHLNEGSGSDQNFIRPMSQELIPFKNAPKFNSIDAKPSIFKFPKKS